MNRIRLFYITAFAAFITLFTLQGCQISLDWYIRNISQKPVFLLIMSDKVSDKVYYPEFHKKLKVKYSDSILPVNYKLGEHLNKSIFTNPVDSNQCWIILPAHSTCRFTGIIPTDFARNFNTVFEFRQNGKILAFNTLDVFSRNNPFKMYGGLWVKNIAVYDFKGL